MSCNDGCSSTCGRACSDNCSGTLTGGQIETPTTCVGSCASGCYNTCTGTTTGQSGCTTCGSGCAGTCTGTCIGTATGHSTSLPEQSAVPNIPTTPGYEETDENLYSAFPNGSGMNPSVWRQVRENMKRLRSISKLLNELDMWDILGDEYPDLAALIREMLKILDDLVDRIGTLSALVNNMNVNTQPNQYKYDITYEFKNPKVIGLGNKRGFIDLTHCLVQTVITSSVKEDTNFTPYQIALGNDMKQYYRTATVDKTGRYIWGEWKEIRYGTQILVRDTFPNDDEQAVGDWLAIPIN